MPTTFELHVFSPKPKSYSVRLIENALARPDTAIVVPCQPAYGARESFCFENVRDVVKKHSGRIAYGWVVWQHGEIFVEAEHHAVWEKDNGELLCITPQNPTETELTFIPDPSTVYVFESHQTTANISVGLFNEPALEEFFKASKLQTFLRNQASRVHWPEIKFTPEQEQEYMMLEQLKQTTGSRAIQKRLTSVQRNDLCPCGSGKKFKKCHLDA